MKAGIIFTGTGPILILTSCSSFTDPKLIEKLAAKGIRKFIAYELPVESVKKSIKKSYLLRAVTGVAGFNLSRATRRV